MSHATAFYISDDPRIREDEFDSSWLLEMPAAKFGVLDTYDGDEKEQREEIVRLLDRLEELGAAVDRDERSFILTAEVVKKYFGTRFQALCAAVQAMTPDTFAGAYEHTPNAPVPTDIWTIQNLIEDEYTDIVYDHGNYLCMDAFMRHAMFELRVGRNNGTYYIGGAADIKY